MDLSAEDIPRNHSARPEADRPREPGEVSPIAGIELRVCECHVWKQEGNVGHRGTDPQPNQKGPGDRSSARRVLGRGKCYGDCRRQRERNDQLRFIQSSQHDHRSRCGRQRHKTMPFQMLRDVHGVPSGLVISRFGPAPKPSSETVKLSTRSLDMVIPSCE